MEIVRRVRSMREISKQARTKGQRIGFVPTMGFLHQGHLALIRKMREQADLVVVSIFVNPTQFGPEEDYERYPRDLTRDTDLCIREGVDYLFVPTADEIYPPGPRTYVEIPDLSASIEGASRPGHFRGVATVVLKLINVVQPHAAAFGQKDAQQAIVIRRMVEDLILDLELHVIPTVRRKGAGPVQPQQVPDAGVLRGGPGHTSFTGSSASRGWRGADETRGSARGGPGSASRRAIAEDRLRRAGGSPDDGAGRTDRRPGVVAGCRRVRRNAITRQCHDRTPGGSLVGLPERDLGPTARCRIHFVTSPDPTSPWTRRPAGDGRRPAREELYSR